MRWRRPSFVLLEGGLQYARYSPERAGRCTPWLLAVRHASVPPISKECAGALQGQSDNVCNPASAVGRKELPRSFLERPVCDECGKRFSTPGNLTRHYRAVHSGEKPYKCDLCDVAFSRSSDLIKHLRVHSGEKPFTCDLCSAAFAVSSDLIKHRRTHTGEKPYKCDVCDAAFASANAFTRHRRTHTGEKPYKCEVCGEAFAGAGDLTNHRRLHTGEKPYECELCRESFATSSILQRHRRLHTRE